MNNDEFIDNLFSEFDVRFSDGKKEYDASGSEFDDVKTHFHDEYCEYVVIDFYGNNPTDSRTKVFDTYEEALLDLYTRFDDAHGLCILKKLDAETGWYRDVFASVEDNQNVLECDGMFKVLDGDVNDYHYGYINEIESNEYKEQICTLVDTKMFERWMWVIRMAVLSLKDKKTDMYDNIGYSDFDALLLFIRACVDNMWTIRDNIKNDSEIFSYKRRDLFKEALKK